jgi:hypothetical protein
MKVSYRNWPIIKKLEDNRLGNLPIYEGDKLYFDYFGQNFTSYWKLYSNNFKNEINYITWPFYQASKRAQDKLVQLYQDIILQEIDDFKVSGCFLMDGNMFMLHKEIRRDTQDFECAFFMFTREGIPLAMYVDSAEHSIFQNGFISSVFGLKLSEEEIKNWLTYKIIELVIIKMFKSYAEVETKILPPNSKTKYGDTKCINDTESKITHLDSKWFTNLVKSNGFNVRGHFRLQPKKKDGQWIRELIWINEFEKSGYTAPARKTLISQ